MLVVLWYVGWLAGEEEAEKKEMLGEGGKQGGERRGEGMEGDLGDGKKGRGCECRVIA